MLNFSTFILLIEKTTQPLFYFVTELVLRYGELWRSISIVTHVLLEYYNISNYLSIYPVPGNVRHLQVREVLVIQPIRACPSVMLGVSKKHVYMPKCFLHAPWCSLGIKEPYHIVIANLDTQESCLSRFIGQFSSK
jgi:hypothetical protein